MDAVIFPTIIETCLGCFYLRGRTFILYQIQRDDFPFVDEGWFYYYLKHKFRILFRYYFLIFTYSIKIYHTYFGMLPGVW